MQRKILAICAALVALGALTIMPAMGSAAALTDTEGGATKVLPAGAKFIAEGTGTTLWKSAVMTVECNETVFTGAVHRNSGGIFELTVEDMWEQSSFFDRNTHTPCRTGSNQVVVRTNLTTAGTTVTKTVGSPTHWCIKSVAGSDNVNVEPHNCTGTGGEFTFTIQIGVFTCGFKRTATIPGTFNTSNTHTNVAELTMTGEPQWDTDAVAGHSGLCPAILLWSNWILVIYTDTNTTPTTGIHPVPVNKTDPIYISSP